MLSNCFAESWNTDKQKEKGDWQWNLELLLNKLIIAHLKLMYYEYKIQTNTWFLFKVKTPYIFSTLRKKCTKNPFKQKKFQVKW